MDTVTHRLLAVGTSPASAILPGIDGFEPAPDHGEHSYRGSNLLAGRVALVTGGDRGIGRAVAIAFAREGADVLISCSEHERQRAEDTCRRVWEAGRRGVAIAGDLQSERHCAGLVETTLDTLGRLDVLVNNAGAGTGPDVTGRRGDDRDAAWKANLYPMFWLCRAALPHMGPGGVIVNTAACSAGADLSVHAATEAAVVNFTKALSPVAWRSGVRVNAVTPGPVRVSLPARPGFGTARARGAEPVNLAPLYVHLASEAARVGPGDVYGPTGSVLRG